MWRTCGLHTRPQNVLICWQEAPGSNAVHGLEVVNRRIIELELPGASVSWGEANKDSIVTWTEKQPP